jgi:hypothetical protein
MILMVGDDMLPAHSDLGASSMERWSHCPASFGLSQRERHKAPTIHAATGTVAHAVLERAIHELGQGGDPFEELRANQGITTTVDGYDVTVDEAMTDGVRVMLEYVMTRSRELKVSPRVERTVFLDKYFTGSPPPVRMFGRCDVHFLAHDLVEIADYKNGSGVLVSVTDNVQLMYYSAGVLAELIGLGIWPANVRLTLVQPNARTPEKIRSQDLTALDVEMWVDEVLIPAVRACEDPEAPYVTGPWCRFCPVAHACPMLLLAAQDAAKVQFDDSAEGQTIATRLHLAETVLLWAGAMKGYGLERIREGVEVPGWAEVPTRPTRGWTDTDTVSQTLTSAGVDAWKAELKSPAQIEKLVKKGSSIWRTVEPFVESKSSGTKLARVTSDGGDDMGLFDDLEG